MNLMTELFSDIFARRDNCLTRLDPRTKLVVALTTLLCLVFSRQPFFPLVVLGLAVATTVAVKVPVRLVARRLAAPMGLALVLMVLQSVLTGTTPLWSFQVLSWKITVTQEGWQNGRLIAARVLAAVSVILLLSSVTPAHRIFHTLRMLGLPRGWVEIALLMYRYIFVLLDLVADMTAAQKLRLGYSGVRRTWTSAGIVAGTVIVRSVDQAARTHEAMVVRGYSGEIPFGTLPPLTRRDWWIMGASGLLLLEAFWLMQMRLG